MRKQAFVLYRRGRVYYMAYYDSDGKRVTRSTGQTKASLADIHARQFLGATTLENFTSGFFDADGQWAQARRASGKRLSPRYLLEKADHLRVHILPKFGAWKLEAIRASDIRTWILALRRSSQTRKHVLQTFKDVLQEAVFRELIEVNPVILVGSITAHHVERGVFSDGDLALLFPADHEKLLAVWGSLRNAAMFSVLLSTGIRSGEMTNLRWQDIDFDNGIMLVHGTKTKTSHRPALLTSRSRGLLEELKGSRRPDDYVFVSKRGEPLNRRTVSTVLRRSMDRCGIDSTGRNLVVHSFRHTFATRLEASIPRHHLKVLTGHATDQMLEGYTHRELLQVGVQMKSHLLAIEALQCQASSPTVASTAG